MPFLVIGYWTVVVLHILPFKRTAAKGFNIFFNIKTEEWGICICLLYWSINQFPIFTHVNNKKSVGITRQMEYSTIVFGIISFHGYNQTMFWNWLKKLTVCV